MNTMRVLALAALTAVYAVGASAQTALATNPPATQSLEPPYILLVVRQEVQYGKAPARQKLETALTRLCNRIDVPNTWIDLQSLTGPRQVLFFDPFDSFDEMEQSSMDWSKVYAAHPDLARMQEEIDAMLKTEDTTVAVRRDDLGYLVDHIDFSMMRYMRIVEVHLLPGHEADFVEANHILSDAFTMLGEDTPWVVYQAKLGSDSPVFLTFMPMADLTQNDDLLAWEEDLRKAEGEEGIKRLEQLEREGYVSSKTNIYEVSPEMSHVSKAIASGDPGFWNPAPVADLNRPAGKKILDSGADQRLPKNAAAKGDIK